MDNVLNGGYTFFSKRPVIMKAWDPDTNFRKKDIQKVPIWIQIETLELKYWGQNTLFKIVGQIGDPILVDEITKQRQKLTFPRVLIEVSMKQDLLEKIEFEDEHGCIASVGIKYEWKPTICKNFNGLGHNTDDYRKKQGVQKQQQWVVKDKKEEEKKGPTVGSDGFQLVSKGWKPKGKVQQESTSTENAFDILQEHSEQDDANGVQSGAEAIFMNEGVFDHSLALITFHQLSHIGKKPFRYFKMWSSHPHYANQALQIEELEARSIFTQAHKNYQPFLHQKAKTNWARDGDDNTTIFHASIKASFNQNRIFFILDSQGNKIDDPVRITEVFLDYYKQLLGTSMINRRKVISSVLINGPTVTSQQRDIHLKPITDEEIKKAIFAIPRAKAPGPDGYSSSFFQDNWNLVGVDICDIVRSFLHYGKILKEINCTALTIILKVRCPNTPGDFRPIACYNVVYKAATKVIYSRLKNILPDCGSKPRWICQRKIHCTQHNDLLRLSQTLWEEII
uniref:DUF4283 domain-containing protein n=1 Tax=Cannabis sativa TaxID=3483 RepID=A0A803NPT5_CANSA